MAENILPDTEKDRGGVLANGDQAQCKAETPPLREIEAKLRNLERSVGEILTTLNEGAPNNELEDRITQIGENLASKADLQALSEHFGNEMTRALSALAAGQETDLPGKIANLHHQLANKMEENLANLVKTGDLEDFSNHIGSEMTRVLGELATRQNTDLSDKFADLGGKIDGLNSTFASELAGQLQSLDSGFAKMLAPVSQKMETLDAAVASDLRKLENLAREVRASLETTLPDRIEKFARDEIAGLAERLREQFGSLASGLDAAAAGIKDGIKADAQNLLRPITETIGENNRNLQTLLQNQAGNSRLVNEINDAAKKQAEQITALQGQIDETEKNAEGREARIGAAIRAALDEKDEKFAALGNRLAGLEQKTDGQGQAVNDGFKALEQKMLEQSQKREGQLDRLQRALLETEKKAEDREMGLKDAISNFFGNMIAPLAANVASLQQNQDEQGKNVTGRLTVLEQKFDAQIRSLTDAQDKMARAQAEAEHRLKEAADALANAEKENKKWQAKNEELSSRIRELENGLDEKTAKIAALGRDLDDRQKEIDKLNASREEAEAARRDYQRSTGAELAELKEELAPYGELRDAMLQSASFRELAEQQGIGEGNLGLLACMRSLGESLEFLNNVHDWAKKTKLETRPYEPMNDSEKKVYAALNNCYRKLWQIDFDVFQQPGGQNVQDEFQIVNFAREEATNMEDPRSTGTYTKDVYVPKLLNRAGAKYKSALVRVGNDRR